jgi:hypothetical protein
MEKVQQVAFDRAITMLKGLNCAFEVQDPDGQIHKFGEKTKAKRAWSDLGREIGTVVREHLVGIQVGQVRKVPVGDLPVDNIQSRCSTYMCNKHGAGSAITSINHDEKVIEVLRVA